MIERIRSHSCQVMLSQTSTELTNQFINVSNLKFGNTWACIGQIELHIASITEDDIFHGIHLHCRSYLEHKLMHETICTV